MSEEKVEGIGDVILQDISSEVSHAESEKIDSLMTSEESMQESHDASVARDVLGVTQEFCGISLEPITMSRIILFHELGCPLISGAKYSEMKNLSMECAKVLYLQTKSLEEATTLAFQTPELIQVEALKLFDLLPPNKTTDMIDFVLKFIRDSAVTQVEAKPKKTDKVDDSGN